MPYLTIDRPLYYWLWAYIILPIRAVFARVMPFEKQAVEDAATQAQSALAQYGNAVLRLAFSYMHHIGDAEDVLQDTLIQLLTKAPQFTSGEHQKAWLFRVAINLCKNKLKYNKRHRAEELSESLAQQVPEDLSYVWEAVGQLPQQYREVIHLFYQEELPTAQIAGLLDKKQSTVRSLLHRARALLKSELKEAYDFE